jgi:hypothetical protein
MTTIDVYITRTVHYEVDLDKSEITSERVFDESPEFFVDNEKIEGGIADHAYAIVSDELRKREEQAEA